MDMRMPVMDGFEPTKRIKATAQGQSTVVLALTASVFEEQRSVILAAGCDGLVRKPFREAEIFEAMAAHLEVRFVYEEQVQPAATPSEDALTREALLELSAAWTRQLYQAATQADSEQAIDLVASIESEHPELARALKKWIQDFRFDEIMVLTELGETPIFCEEKEWDW
jgi:CheY-like chemotaxis protein